MLKTEFLNKLKNSGVNINNYDFSLLPEEFTSKSEITYKCLENGIQLIHIFEFENLVKWQKKLSNYLRNPEKYEILFYNEKRTYSIFTVKGKSVLKLKQHT